MISADITTETMKWNKKGVIYCPRGEKDWALHSAITPTPILLNDEVIRIYAGFRDKEGISRIGFVDVKAENPSEVIGVSEEPVLDTGVPGSFDDNGMILGDVVRHGDRIYMYYVGFQLVKRAKFLAFTGLAISEDNGNTFKKHGKVPVLDRTDNALYIRAVHSVIIENGVFRVWHSISDKWQYIDGKPYPSYNIWYIESEDGINFSDKAVLCVDTQGTEYRIGRPRVYKTEKGYQMFYTRDHLERNYIAGYAESKDGISWVRKDDLLCLNKSKDGWDSQMCCYPALLNYKDRTYLFYNGNNYGETGVGYAILEK